MNKFKNGIEIYSIDENQEKMIINIGNLRRINKEYLELKEIKKEHQRINGELREENQELKDRIDKAVEYINKISILEKGYINFMYELEKILKGDKE